MKPLLIWTRYIDGNITCLLIASLGVSTATYIMLQKLEKVFPELMKSAKNKSLLNAIVPTPRKEPKASLSMEKLDRCKKLLKL
ncbi:malate:quinone oxidoreductase [Patiriisocius sp. Uisw_047]|uniref:malate:quinone oxidoreductase n=1 Tax=Patiriisocius sp. Uisw_047 TaxID=3230969 RepID=UPI0039EAB1F5